MTGKNSTAPAVPANNPYAAIPPAESQIILMGLNALVKNLGTENDISIFALFVSKKIKGEPWPLSQSTIPEEGVRNTPDTATQVTEDIAA